MRNHPFGLVEASYDHSYWFKTTWESLNALGYNKIRKTVEWDLEEEEAMFSMDGNPISCSTKAKESKPKVEPPLWEEREI